MIIAMPSYSTFRKASRKRNRVDERSRFSVLSRQRTFLVSSLLLLVLFEGGSDTCRAVVHAVQQVDGSSSAVCNEKDDGSIVCHVTFSANDRRMNSRQRQSIGKACFPNDDDGSSFCISGHMEGTLQKSERSSNDEMSQSDKRSEQPTIDKTANDKEGVIRVGTMTYRKPYSQYGPETERVLNNHKREFLNSNDPFSKSNWYIDLGLSYRQYPDSLEPTEAAMIRPGHFTDAINAFQEAARIHENTLRGKVNTDTPYAYIHLGAVYYQISEVYSGSQIDPDHASLALDYMIRSEEAHRKVTTQTDGPFRMLDSMSRRQALMSRATCCVRIGVMLLSGDGLDANDLTDLAQVLSNRAEPKQVLDESKAAYLQKIIDAQKYFHDAESIYKNLLEKERDPLESIQLHVDLANTLQNAATVHALLGKRKEAASSAEAALESYRRAITRMSSSESTDVRVHMADLLYNLSDYYLQQGLYDKAKESYRGAVDMFQKYDFSPPAMQEKMVLQVDETIEVYEKALEDYKALLESNVGVEIHEQVVDGEAHFERNDAYEGDLHASLGSMHFSMGDIIKAASHLSQAVQLYESSGEQQEESMADCKLNLAYAKFSLGQFPESLSLYSDALDIYKETFGEGVNPLDRGWSNLDPGDAAGSEEGKKSSDSENTGGQAAKTVKTEPVIDVADWVAAVTNESIKEEL